MGNKSNYLFLIMFIVYFGIGVLYSLELMNVNINILFWLSLSSLLMSIRDILSNYAGYLILDNGLELTVKNTNLFIEVMQKKNIYSANININIDVIKQNLEIMYPKYKKAVSQKTLCNHWNIKTLNIVSFVFFLLSIAAFVVIPFLQQSEIIKENISVALTIFAFAAMCFNLFLSEQNENISKAKFDFFNNTHILITTVYPKFQIHTNNFRIDSLSWEEKDLEYIKNLEHIGGPQWTN